MNRKGLNLLMALMFAVLIMVIFVPMVIAQVVDGEVTTPDIFLPGGLLAVALPFILQAVKKLPFIGNKNTPLAALILGVILGVGAFYLNMLPAGFVLWQAIIAGVAVGGTATGLYDVTKKLSGN